MNSNNTIYPTLEHLSARSIELNFTPSENELKFCSQHARKPSQKVRFLIMLKVMQYLYREPKCEEVPYSVIKQVNQFVSQQHFTKSDFLKYGTSGSRKRDVKIIRRYLNLKPVTETTKQFLYQYCA